LTTLTISLSEAVAADKAKTAERNALKVAADATKALGNRRVTGVGCGPKAPATAPTGVLVPDQAV
jgi:hypothetical protein